MSDSKRIEAILRKVREKISHGAVPDDFTGSMKLNFQSGMVAGKVQLEVNL